MTYGPEFEWSELWRLTGETVREIERYIDRVDDRSIRLQYKPLDQIRLLKLVVWARRYQIPVTEVLDTVIPILRRQIKHRKKHYGLGVTIGTLVSQRTEEILAEVLVERYPNSENVTAWKHEEREKQLEREASEENHGAVETATGGVLDYASPRVFVERYRAEVEASRDTYRAAINNEKRKAKCYRGNPWR